MLPTVRVVRIASGATVRNTSRVGARESGPGFAWHDAQAFSNTAAPSGAVWAAAVDAIRSSSESNEMARRMGADSTVVSGSNRTSFIGYLDLRLQFPPVNCPRCDSPMQEQTLDGRMGRPVAIDIC